MNLEVNEYYLNASGEIVKIDYKSPNNDVFYTLDSGIEYFSNGKYWNDDSDSKIDLIAHIPKELHWWILYNIKNFHTNGNVRKKLRRKYTNYVNCCLKKDS